MNKNITDDFIKKARYFREKCKFSEKNVDELLKDLKLTYTKLEYGKRTLTLDLAEAIAQIYGLTYCTFKEPNQDLPFFEDLPLATQKKIKEKLDKPNVVQKGTHNINEHVIIVLSTYLPNRKFTNSEIIAKFPKELAILMKDRSIEWTKGTLKGLVHDTKKREISPISNKLEKVYQIVTKISTERLKEAEEKISKKSNHIV